MTIKRFIKKPSIAALTGWPEALLPAIKPIRETIEIITGRRGQKIAPLSGSVPLDTVADKINEVIRVLQDGADTEVTVSGSSSAPAQASPQVGVNNIPQTVIQQFISAPSYWSPANLGGLALWLDASEFSTLQLVYNDSGGYVSQWADRSSAARLAVQATAAQRPLYVAKGFNGSKPCVRFDGSDDVLTFAEITDVASVFMLMRWTSDTGDYRPLLGHSTVAHFHGAVWGGAVNAYTYSLLDETSSLAAVRNATRYLTGNSCDGVGSRNTDWQIVEFMLSGSASISNLSRDRALAGRFLCGDVAELIVVGRGDSSVFNVSSRLTDANRWNIEGYMAWKWGIQNKLPENHPYRYDGSKFGFFAQEPKNQLPDLIVNGNMAISQRGNAAVAPSGNSSSKNNRAYGPDKFYLITSNSTNNTTIQTVRNVDPALILFNTTVTNYLRVVSTTSGQTSSLRICQSIESYRFDPYARMSWTLRFAVYATVPGIYCVSLTVPVDQNSFRLQWFQRFEISQDLTWEEKTVTFPNVPQVRLTQARANSGSTFGVWPTLMWLLRGATNGSIPGIWQYTSNPVLNAPDGLDNALQLSTDEFRLAAVHVVGSVQDDFAQTWNECARFYRRSALPDTFVHGNTNAVYWGGYNSAGGGDVRGSVFYGVPMCSEYGTLAYGPVVTTYAPGTSTKGKVMRLSDNAVIDGLLQSTSGPSHFSFVIPMTGQTNHGIAFTWEADADQYV